MQRRDGFFFEKTRVPGKTVPLLDGLTSSSAERHSERPFQANVSPMTPKQWHIKMSAKEKSCTASPETAGDFRNGRDRRYDLVDEGFHLMDSRQLS